jgi:uncharacterized protein (TIGR03000 family)
MRKLLLIASLTLLTVAANAGDAFAQRYGYRGWGGYSGGYHSYPGAYYGSHYYHPYSYGHYRPYYYGYNRPYYYGSYPFYYGNSYPWGYTTNNYYATPQYLVEPSTYAYSSSAPATQSYYSGPATSMRPVTVTVFVPAPDAQVWFDNKLTQQQGTERVFQSAPLEAGATYTYAVKARWTENGRPIEQERQVNVQAGQSVTVDFRGSAGPNIAAPGTAPLE